MNKNILYISAAVAVLAILGGAAFYFTQRQPQEVQRSIPPEEAPQEQGLGGELYGQVQNPAAEVPQTNPFKAETNPFQQAKTNPFEGYQNPF